MKAAPLVHALESALEVNLALTMRSFGIDDDDVAAIGNVAMRLHLASPPWTLGPEGAIDSSADQTLRTKFLKKYPQLTERRAVAVGMVLTALSAMTQADEELPAETLASIAVLGAMALGSVMPEPIDFRALAASANSIRQRAAAMARHKETNQMKQRAIDLYRERVATASDPGSVTKDDVAAEFIKLEPVKFRTARDWLIGI